MKPRIRDAYRKILILPEFPKDIGIIFSTKNKMLIAEGYVRVVIGDRGPYIEFSENQLKMNNLVVPEDQKWRFNPKYNYCYYYEYRSKDKSNVMVYHQKRTVKYADYKVGLWYMSPNDLISNIYPKLICEKV